MFPNSYWTTRRDGFRSAQVLFHASQVIHGAKGKRYPSPTRPLNPSYDNFSALYLISVVQGFSPASARCASRLQPCFRILLTRRDGFRSAPVLFHASRAIHGSQRKRYPSPTRPLNPSYSPSHHPVLKIKVSPFLQYSSFPC